MARFVLHVRNLQSGAAEEHAFEQSPVRIGRHPRNELPLDFPFVSQWHGIFTFDDAGCTYLDQGSTNGSYLDGRRLVSAQASPIGPESELRIGVLRFRAETRSGAAPRAPERSASLRDPELTIQASLPQPGPAASHRSLPAARTPRETPGVSAASISAAAGLRNWRDALPQPGTVLSDDFLDRLSQALEQLASLVDAQCARDPDLAAAIQRLSPDGSGDALLAFLLDPEAPVGERAGDVRSALG